jgi:integrase
MSRPKKIPQVISEEEFNRAITIYYKDKPCFTRMRNCLLFSLCMFMGLRPKEAKNIQMQHINFVEKQIYIPADSNKQRNQDLMPMPQFIVEKLKKYITIRNRLFDSQYLFPSNRGGEIERGTLMRAFSKMIKLAGLSQISYTDKQGNKRRNISIYSLRHSFGTNVMHEYKDNKIVAKALRHYDPQCRSTYVYIHTDAQVSRKEILERVWANK